MNKEDFFEQLNQSELPSVIDFWAPWCGPCRSTKPILDQLAKEFAGKVNFLAINADDHPDLIRELKILGIPTVMTVDGKKQISRMTGAQPPASYRLVFETLAAGDEISAMPVSQRDRFMRLGIGAMLVILAWMYATWWLLPIGLIVMFWGIYDRCPIWRAITGYFKSKVNS
ncbi:MAG TPA: hypothetical protein DEH22_13530 [Chloroflexi bacterium]|nr:hypothetical protein [Chloroflexota bacterium]